LKGGGTKGERGTQPSNWRKKPHRLCTQRPHTRLKSKYKKKGVKSGKNLLKLGSSSPIRREKVKKKKKRVWEDWPGGSSGGLGRKG